jgi:hypothetical protein
MKNGERFMTASLPPKDWIEYLIALTPIAIGIFVAVVAYWQSKINKDKLRLDLYNRRFDIYSKTLDLLDASHDFLKPSVEEKERLIEVRKAFVKSCRESQFLFDEKAGIFNLLSEILTKSSSIFHFALHGERLEGENEQAFKDWWEKATDALVWMNHNIPRLEKAMAPYLNFHKLTE